jgi:myosin V
MTLVGMPEEAQDSVFRAVAAVLHLGNIVFEDDGNEAAQVVAGDGEKSLISAANLLGVDTDGLRNILTTRTRQTPDGPIVSPIDVKAAEDNRDSLSKTIYSRMFDWLVDCINRSIGQDPAAASLIGVLDIYGFEQFQQNDFEQLTINLANEKLQQHFNQHVFKMEQAEYEKEGIEWSYIEFVDNQDVLDLVESKMGVLDLLDETCRFPKATHQDYAQKLYSTPNVSDSKRFSKPRLAQSDFTIAHYAGEVTYRTENFLVKNRDFIVAEHQALMAGSNQQFVKELFPSEDAGTAAGNTPGGAGGGSSYKFSSVGSRFKRQLTDLMGTLHTMEPHYIRCIKPNSLNSPMEFENSNVLHQLRCGGVLEAVRISCAGYPTKPRYEEFVDHFWPLAVNSLDEDDKTVTKKIVKGVLGDEGSQFGSTRVFLRAGKMAELDKRRTEVLNAAATTIQRFSRGWMARLQYQRAQAAVLKLQAAVRGMLARKVAEDLRRNKAAKVLQAAWRRHVARQRFHDAVRAVLRIQGAFRRYMARKAAIAENTQQAALIIQSNWRRYQAQKEFVEFRGAVIKAQCAWRRKLAKRELRRRRAEARESGKLLQDKQDLEKKMLEQENVLANLQNQRNELRQQLRSEKSAREAAEKRAQEAENNATLASAAVGAAAAAKLAKEKAARESLAAEVASLRQETAVVKEAAAAEQARAAAETDNLRKKVSTLERQAKEIETAARLEVEDLMNRLNNAVSQRNEAREEAVMSTEKFKQLQDEIASGKLQVIQQPSNQHPLGTPGSGHLVASAAGGTPGSGGIYERVQRVYNSMSPGRENAAPMTQTVPGGRSFEGAGMEALSEMDRRQRELYAKQQQLLREQRTADQERLLTALRGELGFVDGRPVAAVLVFRCCLHWKAFQADRTPLFDRINQTMGEQVEMLQEDNGRLSYWLSNTVALLYLMQTHIKPAAGGGYGARLRQSGQQAARGLFGSAGKSLSAVLGRAVGQTSPLGDGEASIHGGPIGGMRQVEAKYPALLFKQQLDAFVQRIFPMLRDNVKKEISPHLSSCIHAPRGAHGGGGRSVSRRPTGAAAANGGENADTAAAAADATIAASWKHILAVFDTLLATLQENHVPPFLVRKLFEQLFSFVNVQLFNQLLLRRECCSFSNGEYVKTGLAEVEMWAGKAGKEWLGASWDQLAHIRQAVTFLVIHQKAKKSLTEITQDLCPVLSVQQLYRISTMYWDDRYGTETVSHDVLSKMKQLMVENASSAAGHSFLLDDDATIPFAQEDIAGLLDGQDLLGEAPVPPELRDAPSFAFLQKRLDTALQAAAS